MIKIEDIKENNYGDSLKETIDAINMFFYNPNDSLVFGGNIRNKSLINNIKNEGRILVYDYYLYYSEYLKIDFLLKYIDKKNYDRIKKDVYNVIKNISFFMPHSVLEEIYNNFDVYIEKFSDKEKEILISYKNTPRLFHIYSDDNNPSKNNLAEEFWNNYFDKIDRYDLISLLSYNKSKYDTVLQEEILFTSVPEWIVDYKNKQYHFPLTNYIGHVFNLTNNEKIIVNAMLAEKHLSIFSSIVTKLFSEFYSVNEPAYAWPLFIDAICFSYNLDTKEVANFIHKKTFIEGKIFNKEYKVKYNSYFSIYYICGENSFLSLPIDSSFEKVVDNYLPFIKLNKEHSLEDFSYISKDIENLTKIITQEQPKDILIWGPPGFGKTQLVKTIHQQLNLNIIEISKDKISDEFRFNMIETAKNVKTLVDNFSILIDEAEDILKGKKEKSLLTRELDNKKVNSFWIINSLEDIPEAYLRRFDYILEISEMPFDVREKLARKVLNGKGETSLSYKIAQAIHTPAEIKSVIEWCHVTNDYGWANISNKIIGYQKALAKSVKNEIGNFTIEVIAPQQNASLADFAGYDYIKEQAKEILDIFSHPEKYSRMGAKVPKGLLLAGDPGVGKTMFTKCLASELSTTLITADSSSLAEKPERIKMLFEKAKSQAPCIVFIDELDVLGTSVINSVGDIDTAKQKILNQLLVELDGFHSFSGVMVIGATHRANKLDESLTRSGRFGKTIYFRNPSMIDRKAIIKHYCDKVNIEENINYDQLAKLSAAFTSADIAMAVNEAALSAARNNRTKILNRDLVESINQIFFGASLSGMPLTTKQKWRTAIHEAGHALVAIKTGQTPQRVTIKPHLRFLGVVNCEETEGNYGVSWSQVKQKLQVFVAGLVAEEIIFAEHSQGVESDLKAINRYVHDAITKSGMSQSLGTMTVDPFDKVSLRLLERIEEEKKQIIDEAKSITTTWLKEYKKELVDFAKMLYEERSLEQETMNSWFSKHILKRDSIDENSDIETLLEAAYNS